jgi:chromosome partitioning protein
MLHICLSNTKGGVSKSTLASQLAIWLYDDGFRVGLLDVDPQRTSSNWVERAEPAILVRRAETLDELNRVRSELLGQVDVLVLDTPGNSRSDLAQAATIVSDIAILPLQPSKADLLEIKNALGYVKLGQSLSGGKKPRSTIVISLTATGDLQTRRLRADLEAFGLPVAHAEVRRLNALRDGFGLAITRSRAKDARLAAADLNALFHEVVAGELSGIPRTRLLNRVAND